MEDDENYFKKLRKEHANYAAEVKRERDYINEAHRLLDVLLFGPSKEKRIVSLHKFLSQIAVIEDFEIQNPYTNDTRALYALALRASDFAMEESLRQDINRDLASNLQYFLFEFENFVNDIKSSKKKTYASVLEEERAGERKPRYTAGYKFENVPTQRIIDDMEAQAAQKGSKPRLFTSEQKKNTLYLIAREPEKFLELGVEAFYDDEFVMRLRETAIRSFPAAVDEKIQNMSQYISEPSLLTSEQKKNTLYLIAREPEKFFELGVEAFYDGEFVMQLRETAIRNFPKAVDEKMQDMSKYISDEGKH